MAKKVTILVRSCPYGIATAGEAFRAASGLGGLDHEVSVVFIEDGVFSAIEGQNPAVIEMQDVSEAYKSIGEFNAVTYIAEESLRLRGIAKDRLKFGEVVNFARIKQLIDSSDSVLSFS